MQPFEKIRFIRQLKGWSQEEMANRLDMSNSGYGSIERGETDVNLSRLQEIAKIFEMELSELLRLNEGNVFHVGNCNTLTNSSQLNSLASDSTTLQYELEKLRLINEQQTKEMEYLRQQNADLREMVSLLKQKGEQ